MSDGQFALAVVAGLCGFMMYLAHSAHMKGKGDIVYVIGVLVGLFILFLVGLMAFGD